MGLEDWKSKTIKIVYRDVVEGKETTSIKIGKLIDVNKDFIYITSSKTMIAIPKSIIRRIEVLK